MDTLETIGLVGIMADQSNNSRELKEIHSAIIQYAAAQGIHIKTREELEEEEKRRAEMAEKARKCEIQRRLKKEGIEISISKIEWLEFVLSFGKFVSGFLSIAIFILFIALDDVYFSLSGILSPLCFIAVGITCIIIYYRLVDYITPNLIKDYPYCGWKNLNVGKISIQTNEATSKKTISLT